jgi:hypothetical protein
MKTPRRPDGHAYDRTGGSHQSRAHDKWAERRGYRAGSGHHGIYRDPGPEPETHVTMRRTQKELLKQKAEAERKADRKKAKKKSGW